MRRAVVVLVLAAALVAGVVAFAEYGPRETPAGQPPLSRLSAGSLDTLQKAFNDASGEVRVLTMLSPT